MATIGGYNVVTDGLVLSLDAGNRRSYVSGSGTWFDVSGNSSSGSLINGPGFNSDNGGSIQFDGVDDYVLTNYSQNPSNFTIDLIVKPGNVSTGVSKVFLAKYNGVGNDYWVGLQSTDSSIIFSINGGVLDSDVIPNTNTFYIICCVLGTSTQKIYVNGDLRKSAARVTTSPGGRITLGVFGESLSFDTSVSIAAFKFYDRELNDSEIFQNYNAQKGRFGL